MLTRLEIDGFKTFELEDPAKLKAAFLATQPSGRRKRQGVSPMLNALGEQVSLQLLRQLSGFGVLETELKAALCKLHILE